MSKPLTFGIELEMAVAIVLSIDAHKPIPTPSKPAPPTSSTPNFNPSHYDQHSYMYRVLYRINTEQEVMHQIALTIASAGFPIDVHDLFGTAHGDKWVIYSDATIKSPNTKTKNKNQNQVSAYSFVGWVHSEYMSVHTFPAAQKPRMQD